MIFSPLVSQSARHPEAAIVLVEGKLEPARPGGRLLIAPYYIHHSDDEIFYVLSGRIGFKVGDEIYLAAAGDAVVVPPGAVHTWWNADPVPARYLIAMPKRLDNLIFALHERPRSTDELHALFAAHDATYIGWTR